MLVLTRKAGQQLVLPECGVTVDVLSVGKRQVRLGIVAPSAIRVFRSEIWQRNRSPADAGRCLSIELVEHTFAKG